MIELAATFDQQFATIAPIFVYLLAGGIVFAQTAFLPAFFLPGSSVLFSAGLVASTGKDVSIFNVAMVIFMAAAAGNQVGFALGRKIGRPLLDKYKDPRILKVVARSENFYKRNGWWSVFAARFIPWVRTLSNNRWCFKDELLQLLICKRSWCLGVGCWNHISWLLHSNIAVG